MVKPQHALSVRVHGRVCLLCRVNARIEGFTAERFTAASWSVLFTSTVSGLKIMVPYQEMYNQQRNNCSLGPPGHLKQIKLNHAQDVFVSERVVRGASRGFVFPGAEQLPQKYKQRLCFFFMLAPSGKHINGLPLCCLQGQKWTTTSFKCRGKKKKKIMIFFLLEIFPCLLSFLTLQP